MLTTHPVDVPIEKLFSFHSALKKEMNHKTPVSMSWASVSLSLFRETFGSEPWIIWACGILSTASSGTEFGLWNLCCYRELRVVGEPGEGSLPAHRVTGSDFSLSQTHKTTASKAHNRDKGWRLRELSACFTEIQKQLCNCKHIKVWVSPAFGEKTNPMVDRYSE